MHSMRDYRSARAGYLRRSCWRAPTRRGPDLRQGDFAPRLPFARWWRLWQRVIIALAVAVVLKTGASAVDYVNMKREDVRLRQAIQQSYRRANPKGAVVDVEKAAK